MTANAQTSPVRIGILGFGRIGAEHAGWISKCARVSVAAVADSTPARRELAASRGLAVHESLEGLLSDIAIDAVLIATPTAMHAEQAMAALRAGKHVMVEKPMAMNAEQGRQMIDVAAERNLVLSVFHNRRWDADYLTVKAAIDSGVFGKVINIESRLGQWASCVGPAAVEYRPGWRNEAAFGGGGLLDWGSHFLDQIWQVMLPAKAARVFAQLRGNVWSRDCDDFARVCIDFDSGAVAMVEINTTTTAPLPRWHIDGTLGSARAPFSASFDVEKWAELEFVAAHGDRVTRRLPRAGSGLGEADIWERFASAVIEHALPAVSAQSALATMVLLDAARESSRLGRAVELA
jgi:scyllo-inositol 2-dehydrogenase (NADP+)